MPTYPRYTTFKPGELETCLKQIAPQASFSLPPATGSRNTNLVKAHTFPVTFPDGRPGTCRYERGGPAWHLFHYTYLEGTGLPRQSVAHRLQNEVGAIEAKGRELAAACYREAILWERDTYFRRASEPSDGSRKRRPERYRMKAARAKEWAGLYAVCARTGEHLLVMGTLYNTLEKANADWRERGDTRLVVGCCNRLDRCFEVPKFNPLYAEVDFRPDFAGKGETTLRETTGNTGEDTLTTEGTESTEHTEATGEEDMPGEAERETSA